ncbi:MAG: glycosyltransferase family 2 protein [Planctomycetaceae bacterium]
MLSIIVPVLNEADSLIELHRQIAAASEAAAIDFELLLIDDGSTDGSWSIIVQLASQDRRVQGIRFRRNFGKAAAQMAGLKTAHGDVIMTMDADLQDDPAEIPAFLARLNEGFDVVNGWKQRRLDPWHKVYPSKVFNWMVSRLTGLTLHDHNCGLKAFRSEVGQELRLYGELHRFIPVLAHARGFRVAELPIHHRPRVHGHSKYGVRRFLRGFLDLLTVKFITGFGDRPQHMLGGIGLLFFGLGLLGLAYLAVLWVLMNLFGAMPIREVGTRPLLIYSLGALLLGAQAVSLGLIAELLIHRTGRETETYSVAERTDSRTPVKV